MFLEAKAAQVIGRMTPSPAGEADVGLAEVVAVIRLIVITYDCMRSDPKHVAHACVEQNVFTRAHVSRAIRDAMPGSSGFQRVRLKRALLDLGLTVTEADVRQAVAEVAAT